MRNEENVFSSFPYSVRARRTRILIACGSGFTAIAQPRSRALIGPSRGKERKRVMARATTRDDARAARGAEHSTTRITRTMSAVTTAPVVSARVSVAGTRGAGARVATTRAPSKRTHHVLAATFAGSAESRLALRSSRATTLGRDARRARGGVFNVLADTTTTDAKPAAEAKPEPELLSDVRSRSPRRPLSRSRVLSLRSR